LRYQRGKRNVYNFCVFTQFSLADYAVSVDS
jgi:hypothetical protein